MLQCVRVCLVDSKAQHTPCLQRRRNCPSIGARGKQQVQHSQLVSSARPSHLTTTSPGPPTYAKHSARKLYNIHASYLKNATQACSLGLKEIQIAKCIKVDVLVVKDKREERSYRVQRHHKDNPNYKSLHSTPSCRCPVSRAVDYLKDRLGIEFQVHDNLWNTTEGQMAAIDADRVTPD